MESTQTLSAGLAAELKARLAAGDFGDEDEEDEEGGGGGGER